MLPPVPVITARRAPNMVAASKRLPTRPLSSKYKSLPVKAAYYARGEHIKATPKRQAYWNRGSKYAVKKRSDMTQTFLKSILHYDPQTGIFTYLHPDPSRKHPHPYHTNDDGYLLVRNGGFQFLVHRLAILYMTGTMPVALVDHINGDIRDNRYINLRDADETQNSHNREKPKNNTSGYEGVFLRYNGRYQAYINVGKKRKTIGTFQTFEDAVNARRAARKAHMPFQPVVRREVKP